MYCPIDKGASGGCVDFTGCYYPTVVFGNWDPDEALCFANLASCVLPCDASGTSCSVMAHSFNGKGNPNCNFKCSDGGLVEGNWLQVPYEDYAYVLCGDVVHGVASTATEVTEATSLIRFERIAQLPAVEDEGSEEDAFTCCK